jgi:long-chain acyl-CoA synthetase
MALDSVADHPRPWVDHYPEGLTWDVALDLTPVHEQVLASCDKHAADVALDFLGGKTTFGALGKSIRAFAGALQAEYGVKKGSRVALLLPNTPFYVVAYYGVLLAGGTVVNCNPLYTVHELTHITRNAGADIMVTLDLVLMFDKAAALVKAGHVRKIIVCHFPQSLPFFKGLLYALARRKDLASVAPAPHIGWFHKLVGRAITPQPVVIDARNDVAVQQYTGGTTGAPKGAMLSHANIAANACQARLWFREIFQPGGRAIAVIPFFHIFAMTSLLNVALGVGMTLYLLPRFELKQFLDLLVRSEATMMAAVPTLISVMATNKSVTPEHLAKLRLLVSGGAALPDELRRQFAEKAPNARLIEGYGLTEASPVVCCGPYDGVDKAMSIGLPFPSTDIRFMDIDSGRPAALGQRGELQVKAPQVMLGYFEDAEATQNAFQDGWLKTGDVGYMDPDGYVFLVDRIKDLIICSGFNVYPRMIEEALMAHPAVEETTVIGVPDHYRGEAPIAFVKLKAGAKVTDQDLKAHLGERLNKLEMPREIIFKDQLPKTLVGKLSKKELREEYATMKGKKA